MSAQLSCTVLQSGLATQWGLPGVGDPIALKLFKASNKCLYQYFLNIEGVFHLKMKKKILSDDVYVLFLCLHASLSAWLLVTSIRTLLTPPSPQTHMHTPADVTTNDPPPSTSPLLPGFSRHELGEWRKSAL